MQQPKQKGLLWDNAKNSHGRRPNTDQGQNHVDKSRARIAGRLQSDLEMMREKFI